jgi:hypothetical protein
MSKHDLHQRLNRVYEITLSVKGRKSGRDIPRPVWFVHEGNTLFAAKLRFGYQLVQELLANQTLKISISDEELPARGKPITDSRVRDVMSKFSSKYGDVRKYYPKPDVAVEVPL